MRGLSLILLLLLPAVGTSAGEGTGTGLAPVSCRPGMIKRVLSLLTPKKKAGSKLPVGLSPSVGMDEGEAGGGPYRTLGVRAKYSELRPVVFGASQSDSHFPGEATHFGDPIRIRDDYQGKERIIEGVVVRQEATPNGHFRFEVKTFDGKAIYVVHTASAQWIEMAPSDAQWSHTQSASQFKAAVQRISHPFVRIHVNSGRHANPLFADKPMELYGRLTTEKVDGRTVYVITDHAGLRHEIDVKLLESGKITFFSASVTSSTPEVENSFQFFSSSEAHLNPQYYGPARMVYGDQIWGRFLAAGKSNQGGHPVYARTLARIWGTLTQKRAWAMENASALPRGEVEKMERILRAGGFDQAECDALIHGGVITGLDVGQVPPRIRVMQNPEVRTRVAEPPEGGAAPELREEPQIPTKSVLKGR